MKKLVKIKLINWHIFVNSTIDVKDNCLIFGENGSGKSTLVDAIHYVIDGGKDVKFNTAVNIQSNKGSKRSVESYIRLKTGAEGKSYVRNGNVISHIALEFFDELNKQHSVIGVVFEIAEGTHGKPNETFYHVENASFDDSWFFSEDGKQIFNFKKMSDYLTKNSAKLNNLGNVHKEVCRNIHHALGILSEGDTYSDLLNKAIAFRPIDNVEKFVYDYLMPQKDVDLSNLKSNIRQYREIKQLVENESGKKNILEKISNSGKDFIDAKGELFAVEYVKLNSEKNTNTLNLNTSKNKLNEIELKLKSTQASLSSANEEKDRLTNELFALKNSSENQLYWKNELDIQKYESEKKNTEEKIKQDTSYILNESKIINILGIDIDIKSYIKDHDYNKFMNSLLNYEQYLNEVTKPQLDKNYGVYETRIAKLKENKSKNDELIEKLKRYENDYQTRIDVLCGLIKDEVYKKYNIKDVQVGPLCEFIEIKDEFEDDRNYLEYYLNNRRFDILIRKDLFKFASKVYNDNKDKYGLYSINIVNLADFCDENIEINENSLFNEVDCLTSEASIYLKHLLAKVIKAQSFDNLTFNQDEVIKDGFIYEKSRVTQRTKKAIENPFIGRKSFSKRIEIIEKKNADIENAYNEAKEVFDSIKFKRDTLNKSEIKYLLKFENEYEKLDRINESLSSAYDEKEYLLIANKDLVELDSKIQKIEQDIDKSKAKIEELNITLGELNIKLGSLKADVATLTRNLESIAKEMSVYESNSSFDYLINKFSKSYDGLSIDKLNEKSRTIEVKINILKNDIEKAMNEYNKTYGDDLTASIDSLSSYIDLFNTKIKHNLDSYTSKLTELEQEARRAFEEDYISKIRNNIFSEKEHIDKLNRILKDKPFGTDEDVYEFVISRNKNEDFGKFYDIFDSNRNFTYTDLFSDTLKTQERDALNELFTTLTNEENTPKEEELLRKYIDYRSFMSYDIKIKYKNGEVAYFSKVNNEKSGGETQTPFYVIIAASFEQIAYASTKLNKKQSAASLVILDEAFNNMDEQRIEAMIDYFNSLNVQFLIVVPTQRAPIMMHYMDSGIILIKLKNQAIIQEVSKNELRRENS